MQSQFYYWNISVQSTGNGTRHIKPTAIIPLLATQLQENKEMLQRIKLYFSDYNIPDDTYISILREHGLNPYDEYDKDEHKVAMLSSVYAVYTNLKRQLDHGQELILNDIFRELNIPRQ